MVSRKRIGSPFGSWVQTEWRPSRRHRRTHLALRRLGCAAHERIFPNEVVELIVHLDHRYKPSQMAAPSPRAGGLHRRGWATGAFVIEAPELSLQGAGHRWFRPSLRRSLFLECRCPSSPTSQLTPVRRGWPGRAGTCRIAAVWPRTPRRACAPGTRWVVSQLAVGRETDPAVESGSPLRLEQTRMEPSRSLRAAEEAGLSATRLADAFRTHVGVTAKQHGTHHALPPVAGDASPRPRVAR